MNTFCVLPWYSSELPNNTPCCLLPNNTNINQLKSDLLSGVKSPSCKKCWDLEDRGIQSRRQQENIFLDYKLDRDLDKIKDDCYNNNNETLLYQIITSNLCNQACVSCNSKWSTKWADLEYKMDIIPHSYTTSKLADINYKKVKRISILGGEPFYDSQTFEILNNLVEADNTDCFISIITNGSVYLTTEQVNTLTKFKDLNICISIDGVGPVFEYMRWPGVWSKLLTNIDQYRSIAKTISVSYTISALNVFYHDQTIQWFRDNNLTYNHNIVSGPSWLALQNTPTILRNNTFINNFCKDPVSAHALVENITKQDLVKKINIKDYLPEVAQLLGIS